MQFRLDRAGGWGTFGKKLEFENALPPVRRAEARPRRGRLQGAGRLVLGRAALAARVAQPRSLPWLPEQRAWALHLSHWTGPLAVLEGWTDRSWSGRYHHIFGRLTYLGRPVHGFKTNQFGARKDKYGRLVYLDTFGSKHGPGWRRENSFVTHKGTGVFCYNFRARNPLEGGYAHPPRYRGGLRGPGNGEAYRMIVEGPA